MSRLAIIFALLLFLVQVARAVDEVSPSVGQLDEAIERVISSVETADPGRDSLLKSYRDTRALLLAIDQWQADLEKYDAARANAQAQAQDIRDALENSQATTRPSPPKDVSLAELQQLIQVDKADLAVL